MSIYWEHSPSAGWILRSNVGSKILSVKLVGPVWQCHCLGHAKDLDATSEIHAKEQSLSWLCEILKDLADLTKELPCK